MINEALARKTAEKVWNAGMRTMPSIEQLILSALNQVVKDALEVDIDDGGLCASCKESLKKLTALKD